VRKHRRTTARRFRGGRLNAVLSFLVSNRERLELGRYGLSGEMSHILITPRWPTSRHVVVLVTARGEPRPALVVKVPRLRESGTEIGREAVSLRAVHSARAGGFDTIPRVVAFEKHLGQPMLIETALVGRPIYTIASRERSWYVGAAMAWLTELPRSAVTSAGSSSRRCELLLDKPLQRFGRLFPAGAEEATLVERTLGLLEPLRSADVPLVFEHGDLSHPNLLLLADGRIGVVDWELAERKGLPGHDLFFFLTYVAFATRHARTTEQRIAAFHDAFIRPGAWARTFVARYAERLGIESSLLTPLLLACWTRYTTRLQLRVADEPTREDDSGAAGQRDRAPPRDAAGWLRTYPYYSLWRHAVDHSEALDWSAPAYAKSRRAHLSL